MIVYKTINLLTGKIYVGKDCNDNPTYYGSGLWLKRAIKKYGKENFKKEVLEVCDLANIDEREIYWIAKLDARNPKIGYNIKAGGQGYAIGTRENFHHSEEAKKKMSLARKGKAFSEEHKRKISEALAGHGFSLETRKKMSEARKRRIIKAETGRKISLANKGRAVSEDCKRKISLALAGRGRWAGKHLTAAVKKKISIALCGGHRSEETKRKMSEAWGRRRKGNNGGNMAEGVKL